MISPPTPKEPPAAESECRVVLVDDSPSFRMLLAQTLRRVPGIAVVGEAADGETALRLCAELRPDVVVMDVIMPKLDGLAAARALLHTSTAAVVLLSVMVRYPEHRAVLAQLPADRVTLLDKPVLVGRGAEATAIQLAAQLNEARARSERLRKRVMQRPTQCRLVAVAASTGGMDALRTLLAQVSPSSPPVVIVQHLPAELMSRFAATMGQGLQAPLHAVDGSAELLPGHVYTVARHSHLTVTADSALSHAADPSELAPSADQLFFSAAAAYDAAAVGIVLSGMGSDGARGLLALRSAGSWTVTQAEPMVDGMPRAAQESGASCERLPLPVIRDLLAQLRYASAPPADMGKP